MMRNNVIDMDIAIDDLDRDLGPLLAERARLAHLLDLARTELTGLLERAA